MRMPAFFAVAAASRFSALRLAALTSQRSRRAFLAAWGASAADWSSSGVLDIGGLSGDPGSQALCRRGCNSGVDAGQLVGWQLLTHVKVRESAAGHSSQRKFPCAKGDTMDENKDGDHRKTWTEEIEVAGGQLIERIKELMAEGRVRRLRIKAADGSLILEIPLSVGAIAGGAVALAAPLLAVLGAFAALIARARIEIVREGPTSGGRPERRDCPHLIGFAARVARRA